MEIEITDNRLRMIFSGHQDCEDRVEFLSHSVGALRKFLGRYPLPFFTEIVKNIWDHADGRGRILIVKYTISSGDFFLFSARDEGKESYSFMDHIHNSRLRGNGVNFGRGLDLIDDFGKDLCVRLYISTEKGFHYSGIVRSIGFFA